MDVSARNIHEKQFHDAWRGYNQEEVDDFLDRVAETVDRVLRENQSLQTRIRELDQAVSTSRDTEEMLKKTLMTAQRASEEAIASAKAKAEQLITEAEQRVGKANEEARARMSTLEEEMRRKTLDADRDHATKKRELDASIDRLRVFESELKQRLKLFMEQQLKAFEGLVDDRPRTTSRPEGAANASVSPAGATPRPQAAPVVSRPVSSEASPPGQLTARPSPSSPSQAQPVQASDQEAPPEEAETGAPRRGLRGLFWGDE
ncbi:MAG: cell division initiation protein [Actinomycetota bacterium]|jgi:cell division initiation protein|nr:cell division initiation protein [Actinomycetota bacterium]